MADGDPRDEHGDERGGVAGVGRRLTATYGVVVEDVVLRAWDNQQVELTYLLLSAAITARGGVVEEADLWRVARAVAFPARAGATVPAEAAEAAVPTR